MPGISNRTMARVESWQMTLRRYTRKRNPRPIFESAGIRAFGANIREALEFVSSGLKRQGFTECFAKFQLISFNF